MTDAKPIKKGYACIRVSDPHRQAQVQHGSLEQQRNMIERWVALQTETTPFEFRVVKFIEEDISGRGRTIHKREGLRELERAIDAKEIDFVVLEKVDRLTRDMVFNIELVKKAETKSVKIYEVESGLIDLKDRGKRLGFNIKNMMAEEYSLELEEKVTKKMREAMVNNGKDSSTVPVLGVDRHPTKTGMYVRNEKEIAIVKDIFDTFLKLKSFTPVVGYCKTKDYRTKIRYTKERIDRLGNIIPPQKVGGDQFSLKTLRQLLCNPKYRGCSYFKDTWNQFPNLQNADGVVQWKYAHGPIIDDETLKAVDGILKTFVSERPRTSRHGQFILSGILRGPEGSKFYGASAKGGQNLYYQDFKNKKRVSCEEVDQLVFGRLRTYFESDSHYLGLIEAAYRNRKLNAPFLSEEKLRIKGQIKSLESTLEGFSKSLRRIAVEGRQDMIEAIDAITKERGKIEHELKALHTRLDQIDVQEKKMEERDSGVPFKKFLQLALGDFESLSPMEKKRLVQAIFDKIILKEGQLELHVNPDAEKRFFGQAAPEPVWSGADIHEYKSSNCVQIGGRYRT